MHSAMARLRSAGSLLFLLQSSTYAQIILNHVNQVMTTRLDPIVNPGAVAGHVHAIVGGSNFASTYDQSLSQSSSCTTQQASKDNSNYWTPALYFAWNDGTFSLVPHGGANTYYLNRPDKDEIIPFPPGLQMVGGNSSKRALSGDESDHAVSFVCLGGNYPQGNKMIPTGTNCPGGWRVQINMPQCWDGINTSSEDNSHVAYASMVDNGACPASHPKHMISLFYEFFYMSNGTSAKDLGMTADAGKFVLSNGDPTGYGMHGDFTNGWDQNFLTQMVDQCFGPTYADYWKERGNLNPGIKQCPVLAGIGTASECLGTGQKVQEDIGDTTRLKALPGCNPVWDGTGNKPTCSNTAVPAIKDVATGQIVQQASGSDAAPAGMAPAPASASAANMGSFPTTMMTAVSPAGTGGPAPGNGLGAAGGSSSGHGHGAAGAAPSDYGEGGGMKTVTKYVTESAS